MMNSPPSSPDRKTQLLDILMHRREEAKNRYQRALSQQQSGAAAGDSEGVHGWKASREGGADVALLEILDRTVRQIDAAIHRLHAGQYGLCSACSEPIPLARLRAMPFATRCVSCQSESE